MIKNLFAGNVAKFISRRNKRSDFWVYCLFICLLFSLLAGCTAQRSNVPVIDRWANIDGSRLQEEQAGEQFYFNIPVDEGLIEEGTPVKIRTSGNVINGSLRFELRSPEGKPVWNSGTIGAGDFSMNNEYNLPAGQTGTYKLGLVYSANTSATYNLRWHVLKLGPAILLPGAGMILVALAFIFFAANQKILNWRYLGVGALFWVLTVAVKFAFAIPVNSFVFRLLGVTYDHVYSPGNLVAYLYVGALTGVFEAGLTWLILRKSRWGKATWGQALVFGIGFGAIEAILLGLSNLGASAAGLLAPDSIPVPTLGSLAANGTLAMGLAPVVERLFVIFAHIFACVLIFYAIASGKAKWGWLAILYKTLLDAPGGFASFWGTNTAEKLWAVEAMIAVCGLIGLWGTIQIARRYAQVSEEQPSPVLPLPE